VNDWKFATIPHILIIGSWNREGIRLQNLIRHLESRISILLIGISSVFSNARRPCNTEDDLWDGADDKHCRMDSYMGEYFTSDASPRCEGRGPVKFKAKKVTHGEIVNIGIMMAGTTVNHTSWPLSCMNRSKAI